MSCLNPITIRGPSGINHVPCGKCLYCKSERRDSWTFRIKQELIKTDVAVFLTMTYNDYYLPMIDQKKRILRRFEIPVNELYMFAPTLVKKDVQNWLKRVRRVDTGSPLRYYIVGEYGSKTGRPHYHAILWDFNRKLERVLEQKWSKDGKALGTFDYGQVTDASIHYVTGYIMEPVIEIFDRQKQFSIMSKSIGIEYLNKNVKFHLGSSVEQTKGYVVNNGYKMTMPRYYRDKILSVPRKVFLNNQLAEIQHEKFEKEIKDLPGGRDDYFIYLQERRQAYEKKFNIKRKKGKKL